MPPLDTSSLPLVSSTLQEGTWLHYLRDYPDPNLVHTLIHIIRHGANLGFSGDKLATQSCSNLKSAFASSDTTAILSADIAAQVVNGRTHGPFIAAPFENFRASPLGAATRKRSTKIRRIHHLSWPDEGSVNSGIPDSEATIAYEMVDRAIADLIDSGPGSLMTKLDLESAFRHIPVRPADWHLLGFSWEGNFYHDVVLGFGCRSAPYIFNLFAEALHWILQRNIPARVRHYLDDFLSIFAPDVPPSQVETALAWAIQLGVSLGLKFQLTKVVGPATTLEFLGLELDSIAMEVRLPADKLAYLIELLAVWSTKVSCTLRELDELTGYLQFASQVIPSSRTFLRRLYAFSSEFPTKFTRRHVPKAAMLDVAWWWSFAPQWNGIRFISPDRETLDVFTDACGAGGLGGHFGEKWFAARCPRRMRHEHIQVKEMYAVVHAILCWGEEFRGKHIIFHIDNEAVHKALINLSIRSEPTMKHVRTFIALSCRLDFSFSSVWLSSSDNAIADAASRSSFTRLFQLAPYLNRQSSSKTLRHGGMNNTDSGLKPSHFTFGTASRQARDAPTLQDSDNLSTSSSSTTFTTPTGQSSLPPSRPSCPGLPTSQGASSRRPSRRTSPRYAPSTQMLTSPSQPVTPPSLGDSFAELRSTMASVTANPSSPLQSPSSPPSSLSSLQVSPQATLPSVQPAASHTPAFFVRGNSRQGKASTMQAYTSPGAASSSSQAKRMPLTLSSHSPPLRLTPSGEASPSLSLLRQDTLPVRSPPSKPYSKSSHADPTRLSSSSPVAARYHMISSLNPFAVPWSAPASTRLSTLATASAAAPPRRPPPQVSLTTRYNSSAGGEATPINST